jgi:broad specificity phosphatase PhoE
MRTACFPSGQHADPASLARAARLAPLRGTHVYASPAPAARETAAAAGLAPVVTEALAETDHGSWSGLPYDEVAVAEPGAFAAWLGDPQAAPHGGESLAAMSARVAGWLDALHPGTDCVAFCDAGPIRAALGHALGLGPRACALFDVAPLSVTELTATREGWRVAYVNRKATS